MYVNRPSVIVGRHQNILEEVNLRFAARPRPAGVASHIRRRSGLSRLRKPERQLHPAPRPAKPERRPPYPRTGPLGAVEIGCGCRIQSQERPVCRRQKNIGQCAIFKHQADHPARYPAVQQRSRLAAPGSARGTKGRIISRARKSVPSDVTNISDHLPPGVSMDVFQQQLVECIGEREGGLQKIPLPDHAWNSVRRLSREKYRSWEWNFGRAPAFRIRRSSWTPAGYLETMIAVEGGYMVGIRFGKNVNAIGHAAHLERRLMGIPYHLEAIRNRLSGVDLRGFGTTLTAEQLAEYLCDK